MTTATCHFIPLSAAEGLGVGTVAAGLSLSNSIQTLHLQREVAIVEKSQLKFASTMQKHGAYLAKIESKQIKIIEELDRTQQALNAMGPILNSHTDAIKNLVAGYQ